jgi:hypothetical protein
MKDMRDEMGDLTILARNYGAIIGIVLPEFVGWTDKELAQNRAKFSHLIKVKDGMPLFDQEQGIKWMATQSGRSEKDCRKAICFEWPNEACSECGAQSRTMRVGEMPDADHHQIYLKCLSCDYEEDRIVPCEDDLCEHC